MSGRTGRARERPRVGSAAPGDVALRAARTEDCRRIWLWRNNEETRQASFDSSPIPFERHERWFRESLDRQDRKIYVILVDGRPAGVARLDLDGGQGIVSIHLAPECRGRGVGPAALEALAGLAFGPLALDRLVAAVKPDNLASLVAFETAGFTRATAGGGAPLGSVTLMRSHHEG